MKTRKKKACSESQEQKTQAVWSSINCMWTLLSWMKLTAGHDYTEHKNKFQIESIVYYYLAHLMIG